MLHLDIFFHILNTDPTGADVLIPLCERTVTVEFYRLMMHPVPILKLYTVYVQTVQILHLRLYVCIFVYGTVLVVEIRHEPVARKARPVARHVNGDSTYNNFIPVVRIIKVYHISLEVCRRRCPCPFIILCDIIKFMFLHYRQTMPVADNGIRGNVSIGGKHYRLTGIVTRPVGGKFHSKI